MDRPTLIFDLDDTLVATKAVWLTAERAVLEALNARYDDNFLASLSGRSAEDVAHLIHHHANTARPLAEIQADFARELLHAMETIPLSAMPGADELVRTKSRSWRKVIASGSPRSVIEVALRRVGLADCFEFAVSSSEVGEGKPSPKVFLEAARRAQAPLDSCLIIEDSLVGAQAAKAAGIACFVVPSRPETVAAIRALATSVFGSLAEISEGAMRNALRVNPGARAGRAG